MPDGVANQFDNTKAVTQKEKREAAKAFRKKPQQLLDMAYKALKRIVRQNQAGHPVGHDAMVAARHVVRLIERSRQAPSSASDADA